MTPEQLLDKVATARRGDAITYHIGWLARDRERNATLNVLADAAYRLYQEGRGLLVQRRVLKTDGSPEYVYMVIKTEPKRHVRRVTYAPYAQAHA